MYWWWTNTKKKKKIDEKRPAAYHIVHRMKATYCMVRWTANGAKERARAFSLAGCKECRNPKAKWQKNKEIVVRSTWHWCFTVPSIYPVANSFISNSISILIVLQLLILLFFFSFYLLLCVLCCAAALKLYCCCCPFTVFVVQFVSVRCWSMFVSRCLFPTVVHVLVRYHRHTRC